ncbi:hypothetical protein YC2023_122978 [Brassica napus]
MNIHTATKSERTTSVKNHFQAPPLLTDLRRCGFVPKTGSVSYTPSLPCFEWGVNTLTTTSGSIQSKTLDGFRMNKNLTGGGAEEASAESNAIA